MKGLHADEMCERKPRDTGVRNLWPRLLLATSRFGSMSNVARQTVQIVMKTDGLQHMSGGLRQSNRLGPRTLRQPQQSLNRYLVAKQHWTQ